MNAISPRPHLENSLSCIRFNVFTEVTVKNPALWDIKTQLVPHRKYYVSATEHTRLMLCKIWGFQDGDYEECCLLGYINQVSTSQETH
jgi:hypothetical protein